MAAVVVHGGAYSIPDSTVTKCRSGCSEAAEKAYLILKAGKSAVDAVETAVRSLEDNPTFAAGHGSCLNRAGDVEMDAIIADGRNLSYGAVAGVKNISNPVSLARMVMEKTNHVMLIGEGANQFATEMGVRKVELSELVSEEARMEWEKFEKYEDIVSGFYNTDGNGTGNLGHETVGAVAMDAKGNIAAASSTGGISLKRVGRVGAVPLIGVGAFADNDLGGVSCTGHGESMSKVVLSYRALSQLSSCKKGCDSEGVGLEEALVESLGYMLEKVGGRGGMIGISSNGDIAKHFTTSHMPWASVDKHGNSNNGV